MSQLNGSLLNLASRSGDHIFYAGQVDQQVDVLLMGLNERMEERGHVHLHPAVMDAEAEQRDRVLGSKMVGAHLILGGFLFFHVEITE